MTAAAETGTFAQGLAPSQNGTSSRRRRKLSRHGLERRDYRIYLALIFPFAVLAVLAGRIGKGSIAGRAKSQSRQFFLVEALDLARATVPWVFMGR